MLRTLILFMLRGAWHTNKRVVATDMYDDGQRTCSPPSRQRLSFDHHIQRRLASSQGRRGRVARFTKGSPLVGMSSAHPCRTRSGGMSAFLSEGRAFLKGRAFYKGRTFPEGSKGRTFPEGSKGRTFPEGSKGRTFPEGSKGRTFPEGSKGSTLLPINVDDASDYARVASALARSRA